MGGIRIDPQVHHRFATFDALGTITRKSLWIQAITVTRTKRAYLRSVPRGTMNHVIFNGILAEQHDPDLLRRVTYWPWILEGRSLGGGRCALAVPGGIYWIGGPRAFCGNASTGSFA
ncbi:hypothetical protein CALVIDRAFT_432975 [Calocera viscosa TUFC12733]|uniref:Uncharacterized protein n=1 Tax=Calocera viscosa (strain TUFC12733) TaxID=1330018 RepID=A0A167FY63_CALVF|nr:hypothetical protein CALVIDRAFT_432975 [Calocera viscosa TUFC12733]